MPEITKYAPGTPSWVDLSSPDVEASVTFYSALFGWSAETDPDPEAGGYTMLRLDDRAVAGLFPLQDENQPPAWSTYVTVDDADATAKAVEGAGGAVIAPPFDVLDSGRMAILVDPTGAFFSIWQPKANIGAELVNEPVSLCWNELNTRDLDGAKAFYRKVFGWEGATDDNDGMTYTEWRLDGAGIGGMLEISDQVPAEVPASWLAYFAVDDTDATVAKAGELGGSVVVPPTDIPPGRFALLSDPHGAHFAVITLSDPPG